ncbi:MAG TPA: glycosyltransferase family 4 protein [Opitutaceae bacterium]|nr:glycosyltransferase family 4 protein [Opitutaceae bacterium]
MSSLISSPASNKGEGFYVRRASRSEGLFFDEFDNDSAWIREEAIITLPPIHELRRVVIRGSLMAHPELSGIEVGFPQLNVFLKKHHVATVALTSPQRWEVGIDVPGEIAAEGAEIILELRGVTWTNLLAWLARVAETAPLADRIQRFRKQNRNRQLRIQNVEADGMLVFDFANRAAPYSPAFARAHAHLGLNIVGFITADLGIGESARSMIRAADSVRIPAAAVPLKLPCKARQGDLSFAAYVQDTNPHAINVFHLDAPASRDIDTHHGANFRKGKYNIGYWAWELPEFPDAWLAYFDYFHEIWAPSDFVRQTIAAKSPLAVITMPHAIEFTRPVASKADLRVSFGLPAEKFLFLFLYDLNSYTERKNPRGVLEAFRRSGLSQRGAVLVIKIHGAEGNESDLDALRRDVADLPGTIFITDSLPRHRVYELEAACDCFVSLHRSEGFGFAVAECMYLGKPVIATNWSATAEFLNESNGAPVRFTLKTLERNYGPYAKGQTWAEADVAHAAEWMKRLFEDRALAERLGAAARATIERQYSLKAIGERYRARLEAIASW